MKETASPLRRGARRQERELARVRPLEVLGNPRNDERARVSKARFVLEVGVGPTDASLECQKFHPILIQPIESACYSSKHHPLGILWTL
jgi:hypothetical protein